MGGFDYYMPVLAMFVLQFIYASVALTTRVALLQGMSPRVLVVYRQAVATAVIAPVVYFSCRKSGYCSLNLRSFTLIFMASLVGITINLNFFYEGLYLANSSTASAITNLVPAVTFAIAAFTGLEKVNIRSLRSIAKILGTVICVIGAVSMSLLKGPKLLNVEYFPSKSVMGSGDNWFLGCLLLIGSNCFWSIWYILQVPASASHPNYLSLSAWMCFMSALQSAAVTVILERDPEAWKINSILQLSCCVYAGVIGSAVSYFIQVWCISRRGPLFSAMFTPLYTVIVTIFAALFLNEEIYTGSLVGAIGVMMGLYVVLWGKAADAVVTENTDPSQQINQTESEQHKMGGLEGYLPALAMIGLQFHYAALAIFTRAALLNGMGARVFVVYRQAIATLALAPIALNPKRITANQNAYFEGLYFASSTVTTAMSNLIPAVTFIMAAIVGMEKVDLRSLRSVAKIIGTVLCVGGAITMALLKGEKLIHMELIPLKYVMGTETENWLLGCLLLLLSSFCWSFWIIMQVPVSSSCPDHVASTFWMCLLTMIQSVIFTLLVELDLQAWKLSSTLEVLSCLYAGIGIAVSFFIQTWCISKRGPLFCAMFNPLCTVITALVAATFMHEELYAGSVIGAFAVIAGLYIVLWGKGNLGKDIEENKPEAESNTQNGDISCKIDLEEPLISDKSESIKENTINP
ncbi:hypothetical protein L6164_011584 [Bauhinia variegata]|uniref:Uncharacterized protein n=1 Tax=Bauhinia variegata TaxID=167791 RepID=A0ACB9P8Z4_BAUVA|nr:hypothetical protein L6164_011584 [Bauhinia variegata]